MASLVGQQLKDTYDSLLKTSDNDALGGTYKEITDGSGNGSGLYLGTGGNVGIGTSSPTNYPNFTTLAIGDSVQGGVLELQYNGTQAARIAAVNPNTITLSTNNTERLRTYSGGDISFRDTSTNEAFYWDASAGSLGIGTTTPLSALDVIGNIELQGNIKGKTTDNTQITIAQSGNYDIIASTRGVTASTIERLRIEGGADVDTISMINSNVGIGTTSPAVELDVDGEIRAKDGILFGTDTASANALDDYEEGTWTPVIQGSTTAGTYELASNISYYTKIGRMVTLHMAISLDNPITGGGSGYIQIAGLPFTKADNHQAVATVSVSGIDYTADYINALFTTGGITSTILYLNTVTDNTTNGTVDIGGLSAGDSIRLNVSYLT